MALFESGDVVELSCLGKKRYANSKRTPHYGCGQVVGSLISPPQKLYSIRWSGSASVDVFPSWALSLAQGNLNKPTTLDNMREFALAAAELARGAVIEYNAALAKEQAALGAEINLQLLADIEESSKCISS